MILRIGDFDMQNATHEQARNEMIRSGNDVDLVVQRFVWGKLRDFLIHVYNNEATECIWVRTNSDSHQKYFGIILKFVNTCISKSALN